MSMVYLANVPSIAYEGGVTFFTPHEHVVVDYPTPNNPDYTIISFESYRTTCFARDFADAMDIASDLLKRAEQA